MYLYFKYLHCFNTLFIPSFLVPSYPSIKRNSLFYRLLFAVGIILHFFFVRVLRPHCTSICTPICIFTLFRVSAGRQDLPQNWAKKRAKTAVLPGNKKRRCNTTATPPHQRPQNRYKSNKIGVATPAATPIHQHLISTTFLLIFAHSLLIFAHSHRISTSFHLICAIRFAMLFPPNRPNYAHIKHLQRFHAHPTQSISLYCLYIS